MATPSKSVDTPPPSPYQKRISGSLLARIDIHVDYEKLADKRQVENSATIRTRVQTARERQLSA